MVRPVSLGVAGGCGDGVSFWRQQHARVSGDVPQQHGAEVAQSDTGFTPSRSKQRPVACATGANPVVAMATSRRSVVATFRFLHRLNMALYPRTIHFYCPRRRSHCLVRLPPVPLALAFRRLFWRCQQVYSDRLTDAGECGRQLSQSLVVAKFQIQQRSVVPNHPVECHCVID